MNRSTIVRNTIGAMALIVSATLSNATIAQAPPLQPPADPTPIVGQPRIVNTASMALENRRIVLFGIDPMMKQQPCTFENRGWDCGTAAMRILMNMIGREPVNCEPRAMDVFRRIYAKCDVHGKDIALALVEAGMAVAVPDETTDYVVAEQQAKQKKVGIWRGTFMTPADFRAMMSGEPVPR